MPFVSKPNLAFDLFKSSFCVITLRVDNYSIYPSTNDPLE